ncbi:MAG: hypothetical protein JOZ41_10115 [Chloroflexi bacterium]|nr:hypothetical protein [Chloroflexota bacterium]
MDAEQWQPDLWAGDDQEALRGEVDRARREWQRVRRIHTIAGPEEERAWTAYRRASDALWESLAASR